VFEQQYKRIKKLYYFKEVEINKKRLASLCQPLLGVTKK